MLESNTRDTYNKLCDSLWRTATDPLVKEIILKNDKITRSLKVLKEADTAMKKVEAIKSVIKILEEQ